jgi:hypothetical protein
MSRATAEPTVAGSRWVPPHAPNNPCWTPDSAKLADRGRHPEITRQRQLDATTSCGTVDTAHDDAVGALDPASRPLPSPGERRRLRQPGDAVEVGASTERRSGTTEQHHRFSRVRDRVSELLQCRGNERVPGARTVKRHSSDPVGGRLSDHVRPLGGGFQRSLRVPLLLVA